MKYFKIFEIAYLVVAIVAIVELVRVWSTDRTRAYIMLFFAIISIGMFFFRRYYRKRFSDRQNKK
ncbi:hypothetical protein JoomaDRAFT_0923 [Galbibacter orientalis DSM 19592]|uniref:Uncharacterized protein n=1 Tax=Galbibacter orientalis DSM 19592 TaxID=926559 RepID=I3C2V4_9FLAO|nr:hypothetical protein JoomaDRAFT_0923 [Galbibacter orientalis DSM 19592]